MSKLKQRLQAKQIIMWAIDIIAICPLVLTLGSVVLSSTLMPAA